MTQSLIRVDTSFRIIIKKRTKKITTRVAQIISRCLYCLFAGKQITKFTSAWFEIKRLIWECTFRGWSKISHNLRKEFHLRLGVKESFFSQQFNKNTTHTPHVDRCVVFLRGKKQFRCSVPKRHDGLCVYSNRRRIFPSQSKISNAKHSIISVPVFFCD